LGHPRYQAVLFPLILALLSARLTIADTLRVPSEYPTIQAAVDAASSGDAVLVAPGVYEETITVAIPNLTLVSEITGGATVRHSEFGPVVIASGDAFTVTGFRLEKMVGSVGSRVIDLLGHEFLVDECMILRGSPGVSIRAAQGTIRRSTITECDTGVGVLSATLLLEESVLMDNTTFGGLGAGLLVSNSEVITRDSEFIGNEAHISGGAIFVEPPPPDSLDNTSSLLVERCVFLNNSARAGSAIASRDAELTVRSCTVARNTVLPNGVGGGVIDVEDFITRQVVIERTIIAFNDGIPIACHSSADPMVSCTDTFGNENDLVCGQDGGNNFSLDPLFCAIDNGNVSIDEESPCAPEHSPGSCGLIGALPPGCLNIVFETTWGSIKQRFQSSSHQGQSSR
jgi:hypothetical protein